MLARLLAFTALGGNLVNAVGMFGRRPVDVPRVPSLQPESPKHDWPEQEWTRRGCVSYSPPSSLWAPSRQRFAHFAISDSE